MHTVPLKRHEVDQVVEFMLETSGNDFSDKTSLVSAKMNMLCGQAGFKHFYELWDAMQGSTITASRLRQQVIDELTTNYSYFYREKAHFKRLANLIAAGDLPVGNGPMRVWSAGCASGEEAYNIAMTLEDACHAGLLGGRYQVIGSDISSKAIEAARAGRYDAANVARMPPHWRSQYCMRNGRAFDIRGSIRERVEFRRENALAPRLSAPFDVVMCRNMVIYFDRKSLERFCAFLKSRVKPGGYLFLGQAEIMSSLQGFTYVEPSVWRRDADGGDDLLFLLGSR